MLTKRFQVNAETGIMSRPATELVMAANEYTATITIVFNGQRANLKSIMGVMSLGIPDRSEIEIQIDGEDEALALEGIEKQLKREDLVQDLDSGTKL